ncbi:MAG: hypothetical protein ACXWU1_00320, partial [Allosphingosinicella sp.]
MARARQPAARPRLPRSIAGAQAAPVDAAEPSGRAAQGGGYSPSIRVSGCPVAPVASESPVTTTVVP